MSPEETTVWVLAAWGIFGTVGWMLYFRENQHRRDIETDFMQVIHDYEVPRSDLRRSLGYDEVEDCLQRWGLSDE